MEPKLIEVPGIPGKLQEMSLDQYVGVLDPDHLVRKQLHELRNQALKAVEFSTQLMQANDKIMELQKMLISVPVPAPLKAAPTVAELAQSLFDKPKVVTQVRAACPNCGKVISAAPGPWASHQHRLHPENPAPRPAV